MAFVWEMEIDCRKCGDKIRVTEENLERVGVISLGFFLADDYGNPRIGVPCKSAECNKYSNSVDIQLIRWDSIPELIQTKFKEGADKRVLHVKD